MVSKKKNACYLTAAILTDALLIGLDQWTKHLAVSGLMGKQKKVLIPGVLELDYLENRGAAFGMLQNQQWFFLILTVAFFGFAIYAFWKLPKNRRFLPLIGTLTLLTAGAFGNFIDRLTNQYVVDFISFVWIRFPIFNVADIYVSVAAVSLLFLGFFVYKEEDYDLLFPKKESGS